VLNWLKITATAVSMIAFVTAAQAETRVLVLIDDDNVRSIKRTSASAQSIVTAFAGSLARQGLNVIEPAQVAMALGMTPGPRMPDANVLAMAAKVLGSDDDTMAHDFVVLLETRGSAQAAAFGTIVSLRLIAGIYGPGGSSKLGGFEQSHKQPFPKGTRPEAAISQASVPLADELAAVIAKKIETLAASAPPSAEPTAATPSGTAGSQPRQAEGTFRDCPECPEMVVIPLGNFRMGDLNDSGGKDEKPVRAVTIGHSFAVGRYEITRGEFAEFVRQSGHLVEEGCRYWDAATKKGALDKSRTWRNPGFPQTDRDPVVCVNWEDAEAYVRWLGDKTGTSYRLPSEAEWEYMARAGSTTRFPFGNYINPLCEYGNTADSSTELAWRNKSCDDGYGMATAPVGSFKPNAFGVYDTVGNTWEWTADCWHDSYAEAPPIGIAWTIGGDCSRRVLRGGSWIYGPKGVRSAERKKIGTGERYDAFGFRIARTLTTAAAAPRQVGARVIVLIDDHDARSITRTSDTARAVVMAFAEALRNQRLEVIEPDQVFMKLGLKFDAKLTEAEILIPAALALVSGDDTLDHDYVVVVESKGSVSSSSIGNVISMGMTADIYMPGGKEQLGGFELSDRKPSSGGTSPQEAVREIAVPLAGNLANIIGEKILFNESKKKKPIIKPNTMRSEFSEHPHPMPEAMAYEFTFVDFEPKVLKEVLGILSEEFPFFESVRNAEGAGTAKRYHYASKSSPDKIYTWFHILFEDLGLPPGQKVTIEHLAEDKLTLTRLKR
jgi:formylglycine-generating enzyme required for sulfatase activity